MQAGTQEERATVALIAIAQKAQDRALFNKAVDALWKIHGEWVTAVMAKQSFELDSDKSLYGATPHKRRRHYMGEAFLAFRDGVLSFDTTIGTPFRAYLAGRTYWKLASEKRKNSNRSTHENLVAHSTGEYGDAPAYGEHRLPKETLDRLAAKNDIELDIVCSDAINAIRTSVSGDRRLVRYFDTLANVCDENDSCTDAEVARKMHCSRANTSKTHKKLIQVLSSLGLEKEYRELVAA